MKRITSVKGEYGIGFEIGGPEIRDLAGLFASRKAQVETIPSIQNNNPAIIENKMEFVRKIRGIDFINDAATSNVNGIYMALSNLPKKAVWITEFENWGEAGGLFAEIMQLIQSKVTTVVFIGNEASPSRSIIEGMGVPTECEGDMESAVRTAFYSAGINQAVLYSPGTSAESKGETISQRGDEFKSALAQL